MNRTLRWGMASMALLSIVLVGCQKPDMSEMMKPPVRPTELDRLNDWMGTWQGESICTMEGTSQTCKSTSTTEVKWTLNGWVAEEHVAITMDNGEKMHMQTQWMWDSHMNKFRVSWQSDWGEYGTGTVTYDADDSTWELKGKSHCTSSGHTSVVKGETTMVDHDTINWEMSYYDSMGITEFMELKGVSHRQK